MKREIKNEHTTLPKQTLQASQSYGVLASLAMSMLLSSLGVSIANVALPTIAIAFSASFQSVQWVVIAYLLSITVAIVSVGRLGDIIGRQRVLLVGIVLFTIASALCAIAPTLSFLIGARMLQGLGAAILMALTTALVRDTIPAKKIGRAMGLLGAMSALGTALGPSLSGILIAEFSWRSIFLILVPFSLINLCLSYRYLPAKKQTSLSNKERFDSLGTLLLGLALTSFALSVTVGDGQFGLQNIIFLLATVLGSTLFVIFQRKTVLPLIPLSIFRNMLLGSGVIINGLVASVMMATLVIGPFYLSFALGLKDSVVGLVMSFGPALAALSGLPAGRIVDQFGASVNVIIGLCGVLTGTIALAFLPPVFGIIGFFVSMIFLTPSYLLFMTANNTIIMKNVSADQQGVISGLLSLSRNLGLIIGASVLGAIFSYIIGISNITTASPEVITKAMQQTFLIAGFLVFISIGMAICARILSNVETTQSQQH